MAAIHPKRRRFAGYCVARVGGAARMSKCQHKWVSLCPPRKDDDIEVREYRCEQVGCYATKTEREWVQNGVGIVSDVVDDNLERVTG